MNLADCSVAPFVGAWIETQADMLAEDWTFVAPFVGAWIETSCYPPLLSYLYVAPFVGAWIETLNSSSLVYLDMSLLS